MAASSPNRCCSLNASPYECGVRTAGARAAPCTSSWAAPANSALSEKLSVEVGDSSPGDAAEGPGGARGAETEADVASARSLASHASASSRALSYCAVWLRCAAAL